MNQLHCRTTLGVDKAEGRDRVRAFRDGREVRKGEREKGFDGRGRWTGKKCPNCLVYLSAIARTEYEDYNAE